MSASLHREREEKAPGRAAVGQRSARGQRSLQGCCWAPHSLIWPPNTLEQLCLSIFTQNWTIMKLCFIIKAIYVCKCVWLTCAPAVCVYVYIADVSPEMRLDVRWAALGFACCIMHQSGSLPQEPRGTGLVAVQAPRQAPAFTPHEGDINNKVCRPDCSTTEGHCLAEVCLVNVHYLHCAHVILRANKKVLMNARSGYVYV